ncbi:HYR domain-containing protein [Candidatus Bipolaricaulota bacterium]
MSSRRSALARSVLCFLVLALSGSWLSAHATDYADVVVTYDNGDVETYVFVGCYPVYVRADGGPGGVYPRWELNNPLFPHLGELGSMWFANWKDPNECCEMGTYYIYRTFLDESGPGDLYYYILGQSRPTYSDPLKCGEDDCAWGWEGEPYGYADPEGRLPTGITGGELISGESCSSCCCAPVLSGTPATEATPGVEYTFEPSWTNGCGPTDFSIQAKPSWAMFESQPYWPNIIDPRLSGTPECSDCGTYSGITITAADQSDITDEIGFTITVSDRPTITDCPGDIVMVVPKDGSRVVTWTEPSASGPCGLTSFTSDHASGDAFPLGETVVTYTAAAPYDIQTCSFAVTLTANPADINLDGVVDVLDARLCYQMALGVLIGTPYEQGAADLDDDGDIDMDDATVLAEYVIGIRDTLP